MNDDALEKFLERMDENSNETSNENSENSHENDENIINFNDLLENSEKMYNTEKNIHKEDIYDSTVLGNLISEFLSDFIVIGHTHTNKRVIIKHSTTQKDVDALIRMLDIVSAKILGLPPEE